MSAKKLTENAMEQGKGILRLAPTWVPRSFCVPGRRIKLHPDDYYALGANRGGIDERWFASTTPADNGPLTSPNEGLSFVVVENAENIQNAVSHHQHAFDLAAEIGVAWRVDYVYVVLLAASVDVVDRAVFREDCDTALPFQGIGVQDAVADKLALAKPPALSEQLIHERCFAMVYMCDDRYTTYILPVHSVLA